MQGLTNFNQHSFPEMCASLALCNVPPPTEYVLFSPTWLVLIDRSRLKWLFHAYDELMQNLCFAEDLEAFEHGSMEAVRFVVGPVRAISSLGLM